MTRARFITALVVITALGILGLIWQLANLPGQRPAPVRAIPVPARQIDYERAAEAAARVLVANGCRDTYASLAGRMAVDDGLEPRIVAAVVYVESSCNPDAVSDKGAVGLMQINKNVWRHSTKDLQSPDINIQIGTGILASYVQAHGLREGLHRFNGLGENSDVYSTRVLIAAYRR